MLKLYLIYTFNFVNIVYYIDNHILIFVLNLPSKQAVESSNLSAFTNKPTKFSGFFGYVKLNFIYLHHILSHFSTILRLFYDYENSNHIISV